MLRITLRGLRAHLLRFFLTGIAIVLGVTFLVGSFVITDTIKAAFNDLFAKATNGTDAVVQGVESRSVGAPGEDVGRQPIPESILAAVKRVPGVANAVADVETTTDQPVTVIGRDHKPIGGTAGTPQFAFNWADDPALNPWRIAHGRPPIRDDEIVVDARPHAMAISRSAPRYW